MPVIPVSDALHAPVIFYEWAPAVGFTNGVVNLTLAANRTWIGQNGAVLNEQVVVAHLRGNVQAALSLRDSLTRRCCWPRQRWKANRANYRSRFAITQHQFSDIRAAGKNGFSILPLARAGASSSHTCLLKARHHSPRQPCRPRRGDRAGTLRARHHSGP